MRLFNCPVCSNLLYFENVTCNQCGHELGFVPEILKIVAFKPQEAAVFTVAGSDNRYKKCRNYYEHNVCNWLVPEFDEEEYCKACRLNDTIPNLELEGNRILWHTMEKEKRRLIYSALQLNLPLMSKDENEQDGLSFSFLSDSPAQFSEREKVLTGHSQGHITINLAEADPAERERMRDQMAEPYRTILGHFRHESGHYYWDRLIANSDYLQACRNVFGDDTENYGDALQSHYTQGPAENWQEQFVSSYASSHAWEDWAETWAHYLHIVDTLDTAWQFNLQAKPRAVSSEDYETDVNFNPYAQRDFSRIVAHWIPLTFALNSLNRSMGHNHAYPFVLSPVVIAKLEFVHKVIKQQEIVA
ncbi:zinc-binding metallopeptidase family protein [Planctobacterium marinum]|uniref:Zinc-ribbon domain-containing protein n=1 Tax=Planctobacterium marinum TaxID=1631968 RepID=A0AA48KRA3_9ALTE|nr:hypothetical protein MACH26_28590 [Planctobacterium marinum]